MNVRIGDNITYWSETGTLTGKVWHVYDNSGGYLVKQPPYYVQSYFVDVYDVIQKGGL